VFKKTGHNTPVDFYVNVGHEMSNKRRLNITGKYRDILLDYLESENIILDTGRNITDIIINSEVIKHLALIEIKDLINSDLSPIILNKIFSSFTEAKKQDATIDIYKSVLNISSTFIFRILPYPDLILTFANKAFCDYFNFEQDQIIGIPVEEIVHESNREIIQYKLKNITTFNPSIKFDLLTHRSNDIRWCEWTVTTVKDPHTNEILVLQCEGKDIHEIKELQNTLFEQYFGSLSENESIYLDFLSDGLERKEIAHKMGIYPNNVNTYKKRIIDKIGIAGFDYFIDYISLKKRQKK